MSLPLHLLPPDAAADLAKFQSRSVGNGVERHDYSGHDAKGLAFRFFIFDSYNKIKSEATKTSLNPSGIEIYDPIEMREVFIDKKTRLHEMVTDRMRYRFPDEYRRFKDGLEAPGTPLTKWGVMPSNEIQTLVRDGIFSVEQLAMQPADKVQHRYPHQFFGYFTRAQQFVAAKSGKYEVEKNVEALVELQKNYALLQSQMASLMEQNSTLMTSKSPTKKKVAPKKSAKVVLTDEDFEQ